MTDEDNGQTTATLLGVEEDSGPEQGLRLLVVTDGECSTFVLPNTGRLVIGRTEAADIRIDRPWVSRQHAVLHVGPTLFVEDLGSANGTSVRGETLEAGALIQLAIGDAIKVGTSVLVVQRGTVATRGASPAIAVDPAMEEVHRLVERAAAGMINVLLLGETGVGKEVISEQLHSRSPRATQPFVRLHCAALAETLLESELFGHERGAFTGAVQAKAGLLESADGGTVFLDEIGELPASIQVKLLRVIEENQVRRVGSVKEKHIDVRFVSATNRDLEAEVTAGRFRRDLFFRLNGLSIRVPPLRARVSEIAPLARLFVERACHRMRRTDLPTLSRDALEKLEHHNWPGNIRELRNVIERAVVLCTTNHIDVEHLELRDLGGGPDTTDRERLLQALTEGERKRVLDALEQAEGNQTRAAKLLGISRGTLMVWLDRYSIPRPRKPTA